MALERRAARIFPTLATLKASAGERLSNHYAIPLDQPFLYRWVPDDTTTADDVNVLAATGGYPGRWHRVRPSIDGTDLTDADASIGVGGNLRRTLPDSTLTANRTITLATTNAADGDVLTIVRLDAEAYTLQIDNGGAGGGTLCTLAASQRWEVNFLFDGTDWSLIGGGQLPS